jgi:hypothetical protein
MSSTDFPDLLWRKSSHSNGQANCVEVAAMGYGQANVCVRDSKAAEASGLTFPARAWRQFTDSVKPRGSQAGLHHDLRRELPAGPFRGPTRRLELVPGALRRPARPVRSGRAQPGRPPCQSGRQTPITPILVPAAQATPDTGSPGGP